MQSALGANSVFSDNAKKTAFAEHAKFTELAEFV